jgi:hypothetical protein
VNGNPPAQASVDVGRRVDRAETKSILPGEISGVEPSFVWVPAGERVGLGSAGLRQHIVFVIEGTGRFSSGPLARDLIARDLIAPQPGVPATFTAATAATLLVLAMELRPGESEAVKPGVYPFFSRYADCEKYRDYFKTPKTVSRTLVPPFSLPRFAMGSVETTGPDRIEPHAHPMLDQHFFSFADNRCTLLVDGARHAFGGNCLLHVPLGSEHGIEAAPGDVVNYLWMDFFGRSEDMEYLVEVHKPV